MLLADDSSRILTDVSQFLSSQFEIVDCVVNGEQAIEAALRLHPDVVVLDVLMPALDGLQAARRLRKLGFQAKIIFLTGLKDPGFISAAFDLGGNGSVLKSRLDADLPLAILTALDGGKFCSYEPECDPNKNDIS